MDETEIPKIGIIVLAAGASRRMKEPKQLLRYQGLTLLRRAVETAISSNCQPRVVVLGANSEQMRGEIEDLPINICFNKNFADGLSSSINLGLREILEIEPKLSAVIITLADQPFVLPSHIKSLITSFRKSKRPIIAAAYDQKIGVPALFDKILFDELLQLSGDQGARKLIRNNPGLIEKVEMPEASFDVDTPQDFEKLSELSN